EVRPVPRVVERAEARALARFVTDAVERAHRGTLPRVAVGRGVRTGELQSLQPGDRAAEAHDRAVNTAARVDDDDGAAFGRVCRGDVERDDTNRRRARDDPERGEGGRDAEHTRPDADV